MACSASGNYRATRSGDSCDGDASKTSPGNCGCGIAESNYKKWYYDGDNDGYGTSSYQWACSASGNYRATRSGDSCDGDASKTSPGNCGCGIAESNYKKWYYDGDNDGYGTSSYQWACSASGNYRATRSGDSCDGDASKTSPGNCGCGIAESNYKKWYYDGDNDGYGTSSYQWACSASGNYRATRSGDSCDGDASKTSPGNCGCGIAESNYKKWYYDGDNDGYGTSSYQWACSASGNYRATRSGNSCDGDASKTSPGNCGCGIAETDIDGDGICAIDDCNDNNPNIPTAPGTACNDGNDNTENDKIQSDGCTCQGTPTDPCASNGGDADGDGVCANEDCNDSDANFPKPVGTACNDGNDNTENDKIQSDGCTCQGTPTDPCASNGGDADGDGVCANEDCNDSDANFPKPVGTACNDGNDNTENDKIQSDGCTCQGTPIDPCASNGGDADGDGICANEDCNDSDANFPKPVGTACNDGNDNTESDKIQSDGCTCQGTPIDPCASNGGDADGDGVCANEDCNDNDANFPKPVGTACNDGNANTENDKIQSDGCTCQGTPIDPCANKGGDADGDGICANEDCNDNDANFPKPVGTACNDGNDNTENDKIQSDGCTCQGTPIDPCANKGGDADGDGICANDDCNDNNPNIGTKQTPGTKCDDKNTKTKEDVIQADSCTCQGISTQCPPVTTFISYNPGMCQGDSIQLDNYATGNTFDWKPTTGLDNPNSRNPIASPTETTTYTVTGYTDKDCSTFSFTLTVNELPYINVIGAQEICVGDSIEIWATGTINSPFHSDGFIPTPKEEFTYNWSPTEGLNNPNIANPIAKPEQSTNYLVTATDYNGCNVETSVPINVTNSLTWYQDADNDSFGNPANTLEACVQPDGYVSNDSDCNDNVSSIPATPGTACNDENFNTENDVIQSDSCTCAGTIIDTCIDNGGDSDNDGICDNDDCAPNNSNYPKPVGTACDDQDNCTINDKIQQNGCDCAGTFADEDGDGVCDANDQCPWSDDKEDQDGDGIPDPCDNCDENDPTKDTDLDGTPDCTDKCPNNPLLITQTPCGCGEAEIITDTTLTESSLFEIAPIIIKEESLDELTKVTLQAGNQVRLEPGFRYGAEEGDRFRGFIKDSIATTFESISNAGKISGDQSVCFPADLAQIESIQPAIAEQGLTIIYKWQYRTPDGEWTDHPQSNNTEYFDPSAEGAITFYRRLATTNGCEDWIPTDSIKIKQFPEVIANAGADQNVCAASLVTFSAEGGVDYLWNTGDTTAQIEFTAVTSATYSVTVTNEEGCSATDEVSLTVKAPLIVQTSSDISLCSGESTILTAQGGTNYLWNTGATDTMITVTPDTTTVYTVSISNEDNCPISKSIEVKVKDIPTRLGNAELEVCQSDSIQLFAAEGDSYRWTEFNPFYNMTDTSSQNPFVKPILSSTFLVEVSDISGCSISDTTFVQVIRRPQFNLGQDTTLCFGESIAFEVIYSDTFKYAWSTGDTTNQIMVTPDTTTTYWLNAWNQGGTCLNTDTVTVNVARDSDSIPTYQFTLCRGGSIELDATGGAAYQWSPAIGLNNTSIAKPIAKPTSTVGSK